MNTLTPVGGEYYFIRQYSSHRLLTSGNMPDIFNLAPLSSTFMSNPLPTTEARIEARISAEAKALIQRAVDIEGTTLTDFISKSAQAAAQDVIEAHQTLKLGIDDSRAFVDAILNPKEPNEALKSAVRRYKESK
jgi:uncharacterized protein (DUF1778 family)